MRDANNKYYNPTASASRERRNNNNNNNNIKITNNPFSKIFNENPDGTENIPYTLKLLGPLAPLLLSEDHDDIENLQNRLRIYSLSLLGTSAFFWLWAIYNTIDLRSNGGFDLGIASFFGSGTSSLLLLRASLGGRCYDRNRRCGCCAKKSESGREDYNEEEIVVDIYGRKSRRGGDGNEGPKHVPPGNWLRLFALLTHLIVVANYILGIIFAFSAGTRVYVYFATYCSVFTVLWTIVAFSMWVLVDVYRSALGRAYGGDFLNGGPHYYSPGRGLLRRALIALTNRSSAGRGSGMEVGGVGGGGSNYYHDEEDDIDDELRALYEGKGGYTNN